ncbi:MAG TPA: hypothetical protein VJ727_04495 [Rhodanobacteraceae bacterium]|nr:hypothetical protein [Rhodanobacteraceae bacterium]
MTGCSPEPKAPEPTVNPHPHKFTELKISVEPGSDVNNLEVYSIWAIGNLGCAPQRPWSGTTVQKEIHTEESVKQIDAVSFLATTIKDRFLPGNCQWHAGGYEIHFMHNHTLLAVGGAGRRNFDEFSTVKWTCVSKDDPPFCWPRSQEAFFRKHFDGVFNTTVEIQK